MDYGDIQRKKRTKEFCKPQKKTLMVIFFCQNSIEIRTC